MTDFAVQLMNDVPEQFKNQDKIRVLINALAAQLNDLATFYRDLITARTIAGAQGKQLDYIGDIVDLNRAEATAISTLDSIMDDDLYRRYLLYKISLNTSNCTLQDIYDAIQAFAKDVAYYKEDAKHQATIILRMTEDMYKLFQHFKFAKAAGVKLDIETYPTDNGENFGLKSFFSYLPVEKVNLEMDDPSADNAYILFQGDSDFSVYFGTTEYYVYEEVDGETQETLIDELWDGIVEWSTDGETWEEWDGSAIQSGEGHRIYLRGTGNTYFGYKYMELEYPDDWEEVPYGLSTSNDTTCSGNMEALLDYPSVKLGMHPQMAEGCFKYLFSKNSYINPTNIELASPVLSAYCYKGMFVHNYAMSVCPDLPATELAEGCYSYMFAQNNVDVYPELPATTLAPHCYEYMFECCEAESEMPPALPATTLADGCYQGMFSDTTLIEAPELPAMTLATDCYKEMFIWSTITEPPELPATTLANGCYQSMFSYCRYLESMPELPALTLASHCYSNMFYCCEGLVLEQAITLPATTLAPYCYESMFAGGWNQYLPQACQFNVPPVLPATTMHVGSYYRMFSYGRLESAPQLPATVLAEECYNLMFEYTDITAAPNIPATVIEKESCEAMFAHCRFLETPAKMPATTIKEDGCRSMYWECTSLSVLPVIYATQIDGGGCERMFGGCGQIRVSETSNGYYQYAYKIPNSGSSVTMEEYYIYGMFENTGGTFSGSIHPPKTLYTTNSPLAA